VKRYSFPKCGGTLSIACNRVLAHMKEASTKLIILPNLEVLPFICFGCICVGPYDN